MGDRRRRCRWKEGTAVVMKSFDLGQHDIWIPWKSLECETTKVGERIKKKECQENQSERVCVCSVGFEKCLKLYERCSLKVFCGDIDSAFGCYDFLFWWRALLLNIQSLPNLSLKNWKVKKNKRLVLILNGRVPFGSAYLSDLLGLWWEFSLTFQQISTSNSLFLIESDFKKSI